MNRITLDELRLQKRWLPHRDKKPFSAVTGKASDWNKPDAWADHAAATLAGGKHVGIVVGDGLVAIDLDDALWRDSSGEKPVMRVKTAFKPLFDLALKSDAFIEVSLSGKGLHIFILSEWTGTVKVKFSERFAPAQWTGKTGIEIYGGREDDGRAKRFIATTFRTASCGSAEAITAHDEVLKLALALAESAKTACEREEGKGDVGLSEVGELGQAATSADTEDEDGAVAPFTSARPDDGPFYVLNRLAVLAADQWFPALFPGAKKQGAVWRGTTPGASRGDISLSPQGLRWWKDDDVKTPVDVVRLFADPTQEMTAIEAAAWLAERLSLQAPALRGLATMLARNTHEAPADIFAEVPDTILPWPEGTLPGALEAYASCMGQELGVNQATLALLFLIACGASVPAGVRFQPDPAKNWTIPSTAWAVVLAPSGMAKSPALDTALAPLYDMEATWRAEHKVRLSSVEDEKEKDRLRTVGPKRRVTNSATSEALTMLFERQSEGVILHADELAGAFDFGRYNRGSQGGASDSAVLLSAYESRSLSVDRKGEGRSVSAERAHLSLIGGIQPAVLAGMSESLSANGLLQRALIGVMQVGLYGAPCDDSAGRDLYHGIVRQILRLGDVGLAEALIVGTPEVGALVIKEGNRAREMMRVDPTLSDTARSVLGKCTGHLARLALWLTVLEWAVSNYETVEILDDDPLPLPSTVTAEAFRKAVRIWWEYCFPTMLVTYDGAGLASSTQNDARHVAAYILGREDKFAQSFGSRSFRDIRKFAGQVGSGRLYAALDYLVERRWLRVGERQAGAPPTYTVDDRIWTLYGDRAATLQGRWAK